MSKENIDEIHDIYKKDEITGDKFKPPYIDNDDLDKEQYKNQNFYNNLRDIPNARSIKDIADHLEYPIIIDRPITKTYYKTDDKTLDEIKKIENKYNELEKYNKTSFYLNISFFILLLIIIILFIIYIKKYK